jgi:hypothetical protein
MTQPSFTPTQNSRQNYTSEYFNVLFLDTKYYKNRLEIAEWIDLAQDTNISGGLF